MCATIEHTMRSQRHPETCTPDKTSFVRRIIKNQGRPFHTHQAKIPTATTERKTTPKCASFTRCHTCDTPHKFQVTPKGRILGRQGTDVRGHARCTARANAPSTLKKKQGHSQHLHASRCPNSNVPKQLFSHSRLG